MLFYNIPYIILPYLCYSNLYPKLFYIILPLGILISLLQVFNFKLILSKLFNYL